MRKKWYQGIKEKLANCCLQKHLNSLSEAEGEAWWAHRGPQGLHSATHRPLMSIGKLEWTFPISRSLGIVCSAVPSYYSNKYPEISRSLLCHESNFVRISPPHPVRTIMPNKSFPFQEDFPGCWDPLSACPTPSLNKGWVPHTPSISPPWPSSGEPTAGSQLIILCPI